MQNIHDTICFSCGKTHGEHRASSMQCPLYIDGIRQERQHIDNTVFSETNFNTIYHAIDDILYNATQILEK